MKLIVLRNNVPLNEVPLEFSELMGEDEIYVGRSDDCHIWIDDPSISRHHFLLKYTEIGWVFEKLTRLGNISIGGNFPDRQILKNNDEIFFGIYSLRLISLTIPEIESKNSFEDLQNVTANFNSESSLINEVHSNNPPDPSIPAANISPSEHVEEGEKVESSELIPVSLEDGFRDASSNLFGEEFNKTQKHSVDEVIDNSGQEDYDLSISDTPSDVESDDRTEIYKSFITFELHLHGEYAPYDRYLLESEQVLIGSDSEKCQIILSDPDVSSVHAVIKKNINEVHIEDLSSEVGVIVNGQKINKTKLSGDDEFLIGSTSFTFKITSDLLQRESERLMPVEARQYIEKEEISGEEVLGETQFNPTIDNPVEKSIIKRILKDRNKRVTLIALLLVIIIFSIDSEEEQSSSTKKDTKVVQVENKDKSPVKKEPVLSKELESIRNVSYELGVSFFDQGLYAQAEIEFQKVIKIDPDYKNAQSYIEQTRVGLKKLAELEAQRRADEERIKIKKIVEDLLIKAREAVSKREVVVAENFFSQIVEKDPENFELSQLRLELDAWKKDEEKKALDLAIKEEQRRKMMAALSPGKTAYLKKEWYSAILKLELFLKLKGIDEDLIKEAMEMLSDSKKQLDAVLAPLLNKARALKEGQDMKASYEMFLSILAIDPTNTEALNETDKIRTILDVRSKKIYREAIIAESLSLFSDAREKFQEVIQISPTDSEYFKKATEKLKNYLE